MTRKRATRQSAQLEIDDQADYLAEHASEPVAYRFLAAVDETIDSLIEMPGVGAP